MVYISWINYSHHEGSQPGGNLEAGADSEPIGAVLLTGLCAVLQNPGLPAPGSPCLPWIWPSSINH